ncbi:MAG: helix-turn-helix transcriptional regulator [Candidatus Borkfalkiaceae bacterium]|nr:helix-turn-helix transcriptional regulator [Christensenellaceae bacterium]
MELKFSDRLKELRHEKGLNQIELAKQLGVSNGIISLWENNLREPGMYSLVQIAVFFDVSVDYLVGLRDTP